MVSIRFITEVHFLISYIARKNESVQKDLEESTKRLDEARIEYDKLKTSAVSLDLFRRNDLQRIVSTRHLLRNWRTRMAF